MSFEFISGHAGDLERRRPAPVSFADWAQPRSTRVTRRDWQRLLENWDQLQPSADRFATVFFDTLFAWEPHARQLFGGATLETQFLRFAHLLTSLVSAFDNPEELDGRIEAIIRGFAGGDSPRRRDDALRTAIAAMLNEVYATGMTREMRASWQSAYIGVITTIRNATSHEAGDKGATFMSMALEAELRVERYRSSGAQYPLEYGSDAAAA
jgi:hemoglobin-like flavoprotein